MRSRSNFFPVVLWQVGFHVIHNAIWTPLEHACRTVCVVLQGYNQTGALSFPGPVDRPLAVARQITIRVFRGLPSSAARRGLHVAIRLLTCVAPSPILYAAFLLAARFRRTVAARLQGKAVFAVLAIKPALSRAAAPNRSCPAATNVALRCSHQARIWLVATVSAPTRKQIPTIVAVAREPVARLVSRPLGQPRSVSRESATLSATSLG
jgi:hypothetical protein